MFVIGSIVLSVVFSIAMSYYWIITPPVPFLKINNYIDETTIVAVEYIDALPGRVLLPGFLNLVVHFSSRTTSYDKIEMGWENYGWGMHTVQNTLYLYEGNITHAVEYERFNGSWTSAYGELGPSLLLHDLIAERDKLYSNGVIGVWESRPDARDIEKFKEEFIKSKGYYEFSRYKVWFGGV